ncbi:hypothetical protein L2E82_47069 [Cichorium intybus]|uniref:Uncharacterized protein n=1 Tax=Cichorium intybus TaxID=13427 RepID=A0ACB8YUG8_CICIN|nr:hypothetical protein L2E82_47069 [Cichorium intybus]
MVLLPCRSIPLSQQGDLDSLLLLLPCRSIPLSPSLFSFLLCRGGGTGGVRATVHTCSCNQKLYILVSSFNIIVFVSSITAELRNGYNQGTAVILISDYQTEPFAANALGCGVGAAMIGNSDDPATSLKFCTTSLTAATISFSMLN